MLLLPVLRLPALKVDQQEGAKEAGLQVQTRFLRPAGWQRQQPISSGSRRSSTRVGANHTRGPKQATALAAARLASMQAAAMGPLASLRGSLATQSRISSHNTTLQQQQQQAVLLLAQVREAGSRALQTDRLLQQLQQRQQQLSFRAWQLRKALPGLGLQEACTS